MSKPLTKRSTDYSSAEFFSFGFFCDCCGKEWRSPTVPFDKGFTAIENEEARQMIWAQEHKAAFEAANLEAHLQFSQCSRCGSWVCDSCSCFDGEKHIGLCRECEENPHPCGFSSWTNVSHSSAKAVKTAASRGEPSPQCGSVEYTLPPKAGGSEK